jgi:hypothetical protein
MMGCRLIKLMAGWRGVNMIGGIAATIKLMKHWYA